MRVRVHWRSVGFHRLHVVAYDGCRTVLLDHFSRAREQPLKTHLFVVLLILAGAPRLAAAIPPDALDECTREVGSVLRGAGASLHEVSAHETFLSEGEAKSESIQLGDQACFSALAIGARQVRDLDLALYTPTGLRVAEDTSSNAYGYLRFCATPHARLVVVIRMYAGQGEVRLFRVDNGPGALSDLPDFAVSCISAAGGRSADRPELGPDPPHASFETEADQRIRAERDHGFIPHGPPQFGTVTEAQPTVVNVSVQAHSCARVILEGDDALQGLSASLTRSNGDVLTQTERRDEGIEFGFCADAAETDAVRITSTNGSGRYALILLDTPEILARPVGVGADMRFEFASAASRLRARGMQAQSLGWTLLAPGQEFKRSVALEQGRCYAFTTVPSGALAEADVDLVLLDTQGKFLAWDVGASTQPTLFYCAVESGPRVLVSRVDGAWGTFLTLMGEDP